RPRRRVSPFAPFLEPARTFGSLSTIVRRAAALGGILTDTVSRGCALPAWERCSETTGLQPTIASGTERWKVAPLCALKLALRSWGAPLQRFFDAATAPPLPPFSVSAKLEIGTSGTPSKVVTRPPPP